MTAPAPAWWGFALDVGGQPYQWLTVSMWTRDLSDDLRWTGVCLLMNKDRRAADMSPWLNNFWLLWAVIAQCLFFFSSSFLVYSPPSRVHPPFLGFLSSRPCILSPLVETTGSLQWRCVLKTFVLSIWTRPNRPVRWRELLRNPTGLLV